MIKKVKRAANFIIREPFLVDENESIEKLKEIKRDLGIKSFLVTKLPKNRSLSFDDEDRDNIKKYDIYKRVFAKKNMEDNKTFKLSGIITARDLRASRKSRLKVKDMMTPREKIKLYCKKKDEKLSEINKVELYESMVYNRLEKMPIVDNENNIIGLATEKDLYRFVNKKMSNVNKHGSLFVAAAIGCRDDYLERAEALYNVGCDALVIDVANGHNKMAIDTVAELKEIYQSKIDIVAGNVATGDGARRLIEAGADSIRCGIGNGSICITRVVSGCGVPQVTALVSVSKVC